MSFIVTEDPLPSSKDPVKSLISEISPCFRPTFVGNFWDKEYLWRFVH